MSDEILSRYENIDKTPDFDLMKSFITFENNHIKIKEYIKSDDFKKVSNASRYANQKFAYTTIINKLLNLSRLN